MAAGGWKMGCFCAQAVTDLLDRKPAVAEERDERPLAAPTAQATQAADLVVAVSQWLAIRWLPAEPWQPNSDWLELELPPPPLPPAAIAVLCAVIQAGEQCASLLDLDPADPAGLRSLTRTIATLNRRTAALRQLADDDQPWSDVSTLNDQADAVRIAAAADVFEPEAVKETPVAPWRPFLAKLKGLAPWIAIGQLLGIDLADPAALAVIAERVRALRAVRLPPLDDTVAVQRLVARASAIHRLERSLGFDPRKQSIAAIKALVDDKVLAAAAALPKAVRTTPDGLLVAPPRQPNPSLLASPAVVAVARRLPELALPWKVPAFDQIPLLVTGSPVLALVRLLGPGLVRTSPCNSGCDAASALTDVGTRAATAPPGSGTGAAPVG